MLTLDFLSESPKVFIFRQETNKTTFGGVLFLIYILIMILISLVYIVDYITNDKYTVESMTLYNYTTDNEQIILMNSDEELNPVLDVYINILFLYEYVTVHTNIDGKETILEEQRTYYGEVPYNFYEVKKKVQFMDLAISYICGDNSNCTLFDHFIESFRNIPLCNFYFYNPGMIKHSEDPPIQNTKGSSNYFFEYFFTPETIGLNTVNFDWEVIKYKDKLSIFDSLIHNKKEYFSGHVKNDTKFKRNISKLL